MRKLTGVFLMAAVLCAADSDWITASGGRIERNQSGALTGAMFRGSWVTDSDLDGLLTLPQLRRLDFALTRITDQGLLRLKSLKNIEELNLFYAELITDEGVAAIRDWNRLTRLNVRGTKITDTTLALVAGISTLRSLDVGYAEVTDSGLQNLAPMRGLRELAFGGNKLTDASLQVLRSLPGLTSLDVSGRQRTDSGLWFVSLTDLGVEPLASLPELQELNLSNTQISGRALDRLAGLSKLEKLDLHGARRLGEEAVTPLSKFPGLRWVDLTGTRLTKEGIEKLRAAKPQAVILSE